jgi:hypothetical protein
MDKTARLADIGAAALVEEVKSEKREKCCRDQRFSFIEIIAFANLTA